MKLIPLVPVTHEETIRQAEVNVDRFNRSVDLAKVDAVFNRVLALDVSKRAKMARFLDAASDLSDKVRPFSACKAGCSFCCNIAATITETEAQMISKATGIKHKVRAGGIDEIESRNKWTGVPCTFLKAGKCSIYEVRPMACRLHVNMADTPFYCDTDIPAGVSLVPQLNLTQINRAHAMITLQDAWADIRDFFPPKG